jgi:signal transduction histidine kinase
VGWVFGQQNIGSQESPDAIAALVDALRPLGNESADLLHAASHELRTPLTSIVGFTELLAEGTAGPVTAQQQRLLATVSENATRLLAMVDGLEPVLRDRRGTSW